MGGSNRRDKEKKGKINRNKKSTGLRQMSLEEVRSGVHKFTIQRLKRILKKIFKITPQKSIIGIHSYEGLHHGYSLAPTLFKIYIEDALKAWKNKCSKIGIPIDDEILYTLLFADDQVIIAGDTDDSRYMLRKLKEEYEKWGLIIHMSKTEYLKVGENIIEDLPIETDTIRGCKSLKFLRVILSSRGNILEDANNKIGQEKRAIRQLNSVLWNKA